MAYQAQSDTKQRTSIAVSISACEAALATNGGSDSSFAAATSEDERIQYNKALGALYAGDPAHASRRLEGLVTGHHSRKRKRQQTAESGDHQAASLLRDARLAARLATALDPLAPSSSDPQAVHTETDDPPTSRHEGAGEALLHLLSGRYEAANTTAALWQVGAGEGGLGWALEEISRHARLRSILEQQKSNTKGSKKLSEAAHTDDAALAAGAELGWVGCLLAAQGKPLAALEALQAAISREATSSSLYNAAVVLVSLEEKESAILLLELALPALEAGGVGHRVRLLLARLLCQSGKTLPRSKEGLALYARLSQEASMDEIPEQEEREALWLEYAAACLAAGLPAQARDILEAGLESLQSQPRQLVTERGGGAGDYASPAILVALAELHLDQAISRREGTAGKLAPRGGGGHLSEPSWPSEPAEEEGEVPLGLARRAVASRRGALECACLGRALAQSGRPEEALGLLEEAAGLVPEDPEGSAMRVGIAYNRSLLLLAMGRGTDAKRVWREAAAAGGAFPPGGQEGEHAALGAALARA